MATRIEKMVDYALEVARDDKRGYSQVRRWPSQGTDFDCSSLMYEAAHQAGYSVPTSGTRYTGTMLRDFTKAGFTALPFDGNLYGLDPGDIMLNVATHTEMYIGGGKFVGAHCSETGGIDGKPGDQTGNEISIVNAYIPSYGWDYVLVPPREATGTENAQVATAKQLFGIDVSSNQPANVCATAQHDFAIVKMSGNPHGYSWNYVNPYAKQQVSDAYKKHGRVGLYHFAYGMQAATEAEFFVEQVRKLGYLGKAMLVLDYEADAIECGSTWVKKFCQRVEALAYEPVIYASGSVIVDQNLFSLGYPIWCASYYKGYVPVNGRSTNGLRIYSGCERSIMWQVTSVGRVSGYDGAMDCNVFYGTDADFKARMGQQNASSAKTSTAKKAAKLDVDGDWGPKTTKEFKRQLGVKVDGKQDAALYAALRDRIGPKPARPSNRGKFTTPLKKRLQKKLGVDQDGVIGPKTVKALQKALNAGKVAKW